MLALGPCIEVWSGPAGRSKVEAFQARRRWGQARKAWLGTCGIPDNEGWQLIGGKAPWSVEFLNYRGQAERIGRPCSEIVDEWFTRAGCRVRDIAALRAEAQALLNLGAESESA